VKRPLVYLAVFYCLGIVSAEFLRLDFRLFFWAAVMVFIAAALLIRESKVFFFLLLALSLSSGYLNLINSHIIPGCHILNLLEPLSSPGCLLEGFVSSPPEEMGGRGWFVFRLRRVRAENMGYNCCGDILVRMNFVPEARYGENLFLAGNPRRLFNFNRHAGGYLDYLARQDIYLALQVKERGQVVRRGGFSGSKIIRGCLNLRSYLERRIELYLPELPAVILKAMVLGQRRNIPLRIKDIMVKTGTVHILVVSGFNVGIMVFIFNLLFKLARVPRRTRMFLISFCLIVYCMVTGSSDPVIRATVMGLVFLAAYFFEREPDIYNSLALAAFFILGVNPRQLFDAGFQLSFASVFSIVFLYPRLNAFICPDGRRVNKFLRYLIEGCLVSFSAWAGTLAIILMNFRILSLVTVLANILVVPLAALITVSGFIFLLVSLVFPAAGHVFSLAPALLVNIFLNINAYLAKLPFASFSI
jgi:competence protein ComEC